MSEILPKPAYIDAMAEAAKAKAFVLFVNPYDGFWTIARVLNWDNGFHDRFETDEAYTHGPTEEPRSYRGHTTFDIGNRYVLTFESDEAARGAVEQIAHAFHVMAEARQQELDKFRVFAKMLG